MSNQVVHFGERAVRQIVHMGIEEYAEHGGDPCDVARRIVDATMMMIRNGNLVNGIIVGDDEMDRMK